ncbi:carnosine N-methyltransferase [Adelges cooleyi]|uniref:carnosine N-methyltransferase n=1 Tax=Adelges cooleyi TaxID=133065 RepID=UPI0021805D2D|nr:carnosine N-methyltransferase [Adelges cooleyi]
MEINPMELEEERKSFQRIITAFMYYRTHSLNRLNKSVNYLKSLPEQHQRLLINYSTNLETIRHCIQSNYNVILEIIKDTTCLFENQDTPSPDRWRTPDVCKPIATDLEKVQSTLKQFVRDWSNEGVEERNTCYKPIIEDILKEFPLDTVEPHEVKVLVPGAGLGRLVFEIAKLGYNSQGNEFSVFMLIASNFILNKCRGVNTYRLYPWIHQCDNNLETEHQMQCVSFPDINPAQELPRNASISMAAGDFLQVYTDKNEWNCIATCFFIDCANNVVAFIETIYKILKPGGIWINLGPLLYHYSNVFDQDSIEPSYQVIKEVITGIGFKFEKEILNIPTKYAQNPQSMLQYEYKSVYFVCRKPKLPHAISPSTSENCISDNIDNYDYPIKHLNDTSFNIQQ